MASSYTLHPGLRVLHARFTGHLTFAGLFDVLDQALADPEHADGTNIIADFLAVRRFDMDWSSQRQLTRRLSGLAQWTGLPRSCAILVNGEPSWSLAGSIVGSITLRSPVVFERFRSPAPGLRFVGLDPYRHLERFGYLPVP